MATETAKAFREMRRLRLPPIPSVRDLVKLYKLTAIKQLSQNFLMDEKLTSKIAKSSGAITDCYVCEVGPGPGGITRSILERKPSKIILIEKDMRFEKSLRLLEEAAPGKFDIFWGDVMSFEMSKMFPEDLKTQWDGHLPKINIIGNLPFNISTPLISRWLSNISERNNAWSYGRVPMTLTFQKEVAERLVAEAATEQRSRLSIMSQYLTHCSLKFVIKGTAFVPKPDVDVGVVRFVPRKEPLIQQPYELVQKFVRQTFCMRGKYCCRPISTLFPKYVRVTFTKMLFEMSLVYPHTRPYQLTMEDFERLCNAYAEIRQKYPEVSKYEYRAGRADIRWEKEYASKYESLKDPINSRQAAWIAPLDMVADDLADDCKDEILIDNLDDEEILYLK